MRRTTWPLPWRRSRRTCAPASRARPMGRSHALLSSSKISADGSALRKSATTVATAASSLKHGTRTAIRMVGVVIVGPLAESCLPQHRSGFYRLAEGKAISDGFSMRNQSREQQSPQRKHRDRNCIIGSKNRVGHEENQVHPKVSGHDKRGLRHAALMARTPFERGPYTGNDEQDELHIGEIGPEHA